VLNDILVLKCQSLGGFFKASANSGLTVNSTKIFVLLFLGKSNLICNKINKVFVELKRCFGNKLLLFLSYKLCLV
jgi:hypothetical protein